METMIIGLIQTLFILWLLWTIPLAYIYYKCWKNDWHPKYSYLEVMLTGFLPVCLIIFFLAIFVSL